MCANLKPIDIQPIFYFSNNIKMSIPQKKYIVIHAISNEQERCMQNNIWNDLVRYLIKQDYIVIEIGLDPVISFSDPNYIDLCKKPSFQE